MKALAQFNENGDLPEGIHAASLREVLSRFANTPRRSIIGRRLERIYTLAKSTGQLFRFIVFGSFITNKLEPNDVDIFLLMEDSFDVSKVLGEARLVLDHAVAQNLLGASIFWIRRAAALDGEDAAIGYWQTKRNGGRRGIVEITEYD